ncbi:MAG: lytic transglycosylase domain-containing protein [Vulcanimicrobiaceae bacterium]
MTSVLLSACGLRTSAPTLRARIVRVRNVALTWHATPRIDVPFGLRVLEDGPPVRGATLALARAILHTNPRISATDALMLAAMTVRAARRNGLPSGFLGATLLQESAYDPQALSAAGAVGIAQFTLPTAAQYGVDPFVVGDAIDGAAALLASYVRAYRRHADRYDLALAAYNAGPGAVAAYHGVPPYRQTRAYIAIIFDRWTQILGYERAAGQSFVHHGE